ERYGFLCHDKIMNPLWRARKDPSGHQNPEPNAPPLRQAVAGAKGVADRLRPASHGAHAVPDILVNKGHENVIFEPCRGHPWGSYSRVSAGRVAEVLKRQISPPAPKS